MISFKSWMFIKQSSAVSLRKETFNRNSTLHERN